MRAALHTAAAAAAAAAGLGGGATDRPGIADAETLEDVLTGLTIVLAGWGRGAGGTLPHAHRVDCVLLAGQIQVPGLLCGGGGGGGEIVCGGALVLGGGAGVVVVLVRL